ncbi:MAG: hypothetical protein Tsb006_0930 [Rickettsiaceae bacterium]
MSKPFKVEVAEIIRDSTHNLIISEANELNNEIYFSRVKYFIGLLEGSRNEAYLDGILDPDKPARFISVAKFYSLDKTTQDKLRADCLARPGGKKPITTVGIGANLELEGILDKFDTLLGTPGLMDQVYLGKAELTNLQVEIIFKDCISERLVELHKIYDSDWPKLRANERIAILSLYFNYPGLVGKNTNFRKHIQNYVKTNDETYLRKAVDEVARRSNPSKDPGIQNRRYAEAELLSSYDSQTYTKANESPDAAKLKIATIGKTVIPLSNSDLPVNGTNAKYFIWRTKMDQQVRYEHVLLEGKVFRKDNPPKYMPGTMNNCRCHAEEVPDYILINDGVEKNRAFELYLRKGIKHPILFSPA